MRPRVLALLACAVALPFLFADEEEEEDERPEIFVDSDVVSMHLSHAKRLEQDQDWRALFRLFQDLLAKHPDRVWEVEPGRYVGIRQEILRRLRGYPAEARRIYLELQTPDAAVLWERFRQKGDETLLRQLCDQYSLTSYGGAAARLLARRAQERGDGGQALALWTRLVAENSSPPEERARLVLETALHARRAGLAERLSWAANQVTSEMAAIPVRVGDREMSLAQAIDAVRAASPPPSATALTDWASPGGSDANDRVGTGDAVPEVCAWSFPRTEEPRGEDLSLPPNIAFAPAVVGDRLFFSDGQTVIALALKTGELKWRSASGRVDPRQEFQFLEHIRRFSGASVEAVLGCTVQGGVVYANLVTPGDLSASSRGTSFIGAYDAMSGKALFSPTKQGIPPEGIVCSPPIVRDGRIYAPIVRPGAEPSAYLGCWSARTGAAIWPKPTFLCGSLRYTAGMDREATPCPAAAIAAGAGKIYVQTNLGGVAAVNESNGEVAWITDTYRLLKRPSKTKGARPSEVLNLPILLGDTLWCVPRDGEMLLALDAATGAVRGEPRRIDGIHTLVGTLPGRLVALAERRSQQYLLSIPFDPSRKEERSISMPPALAGRCFLAQGVAYVPGTTDLYRFDAKTWRLTHKEPWTPKYTAGHVVVSGETIISIGRRIHALCSQAAFRSRFSDREGAGLPDEWIDRGLTFRESGRYFDAAADLEHALALCRLPGTRIETAIAAEVRSLLAALYLEWGRKKEAEGNFALAAGAYAWSVGWQDEPALRLGPLLGLASLHERGERWSQAARCYARVLIECPDELIVAAPRFRIRTRDHVAARLDAIRRRANEDPFVDLDPEAAKAVQGALERQTVVGAAEPTALPPQAPEPPVPPSPAEVGTIQLPAGTIDEDSEPSAVPAVTPIRVEGGLAKPLELRNFGGHVEARHPGSDEVVWTVPDDRGWLGIVMSDNNSRKAVYLSDVLPDEPAARAGLREQDQVVSVDGIRVADADHLIQLIAARPDRDAVFGVLRDGESIEIRMRTGMRGLKRGERVERAVATPSGRLVMRRARRVQAVDAESGRILWGYPLPEHDDDAEGRVSGIADLCATNGLVFALGTLDLSGEGYWARVACLEETTGRLVWALDLPGRGDSLLAMGSTMVAAVGSSGEITILDARTGARVGETAMAKALPSGGVAVAASGRLLYTVTPSGTLKAFDPARAAELWAVTLGDLGEAPLCDLALGEGVVAVVRAGRGIEAFDALTGERRGGGKPTAESGTAALAIGPGPLVVAASGAGDGWRLSALDLAKGPEAAWEFRVSDAKEMAIAHLQDDLVFLYVALDAEAIKDAASTRLVLAVDRHTGEKVWEHAIPEGRAAPRVSAQGGRLCVSVDDRMILFGN